MNVRILRDRRGRPDLFDTTVQRVEALIAAWKDAKADRRDRIGQVLERLGFHLTSRDGRSLGPSHP